MYSSWQDIRGAELRGLGGKKSADLDQQPVIPSEGGVVVCFGKRKVRCVVTDRHKQCIPLKGTWLPLNLGMSGDFELDFQTALQEANQTAASDMLIAPSSSSSSSSSSSKQLPKEGRKQKPHAANKMLKIDPVKSRTASGHNGQAKSNPLLLVDVETTNPKETKAKRSNHGGYVRLNGRVEARYRPQSKVQLPKDDFTAKAFRGFKNGMFCYEYLDYFDTHEEQVQWLADKKAQFKQRKADALSIHNASTALMSIDDTKPKVVTPQPPSESEVQTTGPKKRQRCLSAKPKIRTKHAKTNEGEQADSLGASLSLSIVE